MRARDRLVLMTSWILYRIAKVMARGKERGKASRAIVTATRGEIDQGREKLKEEMTLSN